MDVRRVGATGAGLFVIVVALSACGSTPAPSPEAADTETATVTGSPTPSMSADDVCRHGVHRTPPDNIKVERAVPARLADVKAWVLRTSPDVEWKTFSASLATAPLDELVSICVYSKVDGSSFTPAPGVDTPEPTRSVLEIVRANGDATLFQLGTVDEMVVAADVFAARRR